MRELSGFALVVDLYLKNAASARAYDALVARTVPQIQEDGVALKPPDEPDRGRQTGD
ncbi:hypothetical protein [Streptomyces echinatus]|uniref:hypothetical protein n=1 Tax=Streptomyces echinatus TaxID=67293 RepID=UPI00381AD4FF